MNEKNYPDNCEECSVNCEFEYMSKNCKTLLINEPDINDVQHPSRQKAIKILEAIAEEMGQPNMFDCKDGNSIWFDLEDRVTEIIEEK